jgi:hypothetical protein
MRNAYGLLVGKPEGKRPLGRPRRRWVDNIRIYLGEMGWGDVDWIGLAKDRNRWRVLVNSVMNRRVRHECGEEECIYSETCIRRNLNRAKICSM